MGSLQNRELTAVFLVAVVTAVVPMIAPRALLDAALRGVAPELIQSAGRLHIIFASLLVPAVPAVQVTVALLFFGYAKLRCGADAPEVIRLALPVCCNTHRAPRHSFALLSHGILRNKYKCSINAEINISSVLQDYSESREIMKFSEDQSVKRAYRRARLLQCKEKRKKGKKRRKKNTFSRAFMNTKRDKCGGIPVVFYTTRVKRRSGVDHAPGSKRFRVITLH